MEPLLAKHIEKAYAFDHGHSQADGVGQGERIRDRQDLYSLTDQ